MTFSGTQKPTPNTVFNQQASDWVHCEEETGAHAGISRHTYKFVKKKYKFRKLFILLKKICSFQKIPSFFFLQRDIAAYVYIYTKCNDNFKFTISLKPYEE